MRGAISPLLHMHSHVVELPAWATWGLLCPVSFVIRLHSKRFFRTKQGDGYSELKEIKAGELQGSALGPVLYLLYTSDLPKLEDRTVAAFADDNAILTH